MPNKSLSKQSILADYPDGAAWKIAPGDDYEKIIDAIADSLDNDREFFKTLALIRDPYKTPYLEDLEKEYGVEKIPNLLTDGDMESLSLAAWTANNNAILTKDIVDKHRGAQSLKVEDDGTGNPSASQSDVIEAGKTYTLQGYYKTDGTSTIRIKQNAVVLLTDSAVTDWTFFKIDFTAADGNVFFGGISASSGAYTLWDNLQLTIPETTRRENLASLVYAPRNTGTREYLEQRLHVAGFTNLFVYHNDPEVNPEDIILGSAQALCGRDDSVCGHEEAYCADAIVGEYVVNDDNIIYYPGDGPNDTVPTDPSWVALQDGDMEDLLHPDWSPDGTTVLSKRTADPFEGLRNLRVATPSVIVDGDMETAGVGSWTAGNNAILTKNILDVLSEAQSLKVEDDGTGNPTAQQGSVLTVGNTYLLQGYYKTDGTSTMRVRSTGTFYTAGATTTWTKFETVVIADGTYIAFGGISSTPGAYTLWDNLQVIAKTNPVVDPDMEDVGVAAWTANNNAILTKETSTKYRGAQSLKVEDDGTGNPSASQNILTVGKTYRIVGHYKTDGISTIRIRNGGTTIFTDTPVTLWSDFDFEFTATDTNIYFGGVSSAAGVYTLWDNISIIETGSLPKANHIIDTDKRYFLRGYMRSDGFTKPQIYNSDDLIFEADPNPYWVQFAVEFVSTGGTLSLAASADGWSDWDLLEFYERDHTADTWNLVFFVGGAATRDYNNRITSIDFVDIPIEQRDVLRRLILRHKPMRTWAALTVNYV